MFPQIEVHMLLIPPAAQRLLFFLHEITKDMQPCP
jgi:hypothetical protein